MQKCLNLKIINLKQNKMNVLDLRNDLIELYNNLRSGKIGIDEAKHSANVAGKIMSTAKTQLEYNKMIQSKRVINFLDVNEETK